MLEKYALIKKILFALLFVVLFVVHLAYLTA